MNLYVEESVQILFYIKTEDGVLKTRLKSSIASQALYSVDEVLTLDWKTTQLVDIPG